MIANNMMRQAGNRAAGINGELSRLGAPFLVQPVSTVKPNLGEIFGFAAKPLVEDGMAHPVVYWEPAFSKLTDRQLASMIIEKYLEASRNAEVSFREILTNENVMATVLPKVIGTDGNLRAMEENGIPCRVIPNTDLMTVLYIPVEPAGGTIPITRQILEITGAAEEGLFAAARENIIRQMTVLPLARVMAELAGIEEDLVETMDPGSLPLYVATNAAGQYGAGILAAGREALVRIGRFIGVQDFFILPSSLHEVLILEDEGQYRFHDLLDMVTKINADVVAPQDRLTNNVYRFSGSTGNIGHFR